MSRQPVSSPAGFGFSLQQLFDPAFGLFEPFSSMPLPLVFRRKMDIEVDKAYYDQTVLTAQERQLLSDQTFREGEILIVWPSGEKGEKSVTKLGSCDELVCRPGPQLRRFAIAGVGSSDLGAAAFARVIADRYKEPVGAIVAGYGMVDWVAEGLTGWYVLGNGNLMHHVTKSVWGEAFALADRMVRTLVPYAPPEAMVKNVIGRNDTDTLLNLLMDKNRTIVSLAGHSKGALSIGYVLEMLASQNQTQALDKARRIRIATFGTVIDLPPRFTNVAQYIGDADRLGQKNSFTFKSFVFPNPRICDGAVGCTIVPGAGHGVGGTEPRPLDLPGILAREP